MLSLLVQRPLRSGVGNNNMSPNTIFFLFFTMIVVFCFAFVNAVVLILSYHFSKVEAKKELFSKILFSIGTKDIGSCTDNTPLKDVIKSPESEFIKKMAFLKNSLLLLISLIIVLMIATIVISRIVTAS